MLLVASAACFVVGAAVAATVLLYVNPYGVPRVAAGLLVGSLVVTVAAGTYLERRAASRLTAGARLAASSQPPAPVHRQPPRQTSDDYWYPAASTRDRAGARLRGPGE